MANMTTTRPYLIRSFYEWIVDNQCTPYLAVDATYPDVEVPQEYADGGKIILNVSMSAVRGLKLDNYAVTFSAQFGGRNRDIYVPIQAIIAIYAKENGKGMVFTEDEYEDESDSGSDEPPPPARAVPNTQPGRQKASDAKTGKGKPNLILVK